MAAIGASSLTRNLFQENIKIAVNVQSEAENEKKYLTISFVSCPYVFFMM